MPITIKTGALKYKNVQGGYTGFNAIAQETSEQQIADIQSVGATQVSAVQTKGSEVLASIPSDYTALSDDVSDLKSALEAHEEYEEYAEGQIGSPAISITDISGYTLHEGAMSSNGTWNNISSSFKYVAIPVPATGCKIQFTVAQNSERDSVVWCGATQYADAVDGASYYADDVLYRRDSTSVNFDIPDDVKYILINTVWLGGTVTFSNFSISKAKVDGSIETDINNIESDISDIEEQISIIDESIISSANFTASEWEDGALHAETGQPNSSAGYIRTKNYIPADSVIKITSNNDCIFLPFCYTYSNGTYTYLGWWNGSTFVAASGSTPYYGDVQNITAIATAGATHIRLCAQLTEGTISTTDGTHVTKQINRIDAIETEIDAIEEEIDNITQRDEMLTELVTAQKSIAEDWHFAFINVSTGMGLGSNHLIPGTKTIWSVSGTTDLNQKGVWMSDGTHPFKGTGVTDMYARTIAPQLAMVVPSYRNGVGSTSPSVWAGRNILWMGTSIPQGSDPDAGQGQGATYPELVENILDANSVINQARGSSCVRINSSAGQYNGMLFAHFVRALTRTTAEASIMASQWSDIKANIVGIPEEAQSSLSGYITTMENHSFENLLLPYLDGTQTMPDLFVIDHGHNDVRPRGIDGKADLWITPTLDLINSGVLAEDTYMTANNYANLKTALDDDLSGITDKAAFAASLNRNCFKGAMNFLITVILRYNPYARIVIISDYD